jgi:hypothetical protein
VIYFEKTKQKYFVFFAKNESLSWQALSQQRSRNSIRSKQEIKLPPEVIAEIASVGNQNKTLKYIDRE